LAAKTYAHDKRAEKKARDQILRELARLGGKMHDDDDIVYQGTQLVVPESMTLASAQKFIAKKLEELESETEFHRVFNYRPWDGAFCAWNALKRVFGMVSQEKTTIETMFGPVEIKPNLITINVDVDQQDQVPWGSFQLPGLTGVLFTMNMINHPEYGPLFQMSATGAKKWSAQIQGIFAVVDDELRNRSMYRGKAFDGQDMPEFIDLTGVKPEHVVYSADVVRQLEANVWAQLRHTEEFAEIGVPLKRAVLIHGPYGTGKTLAAILTGQEATANGWTFIKARPGRDNLGVVMQTARLYQPAVVFYEDVDQVTDTENATGVSISRLLDDFDGIEAKNSRLLCVLTTNHAERIHKGMARPGRLDAMIEINDLDQDGVTTLVKLRVGKLLAEVIDWDAVYAASLGYKPAFVTEFADRAVRYSLVRHHGKPNGAKIETEDLVYAANDLRPQYDLMSGAKDRHEPPVLDEALRHALKPAVEEAVRRNFYDDYLIPAEELVNN
jgi:transitional endoplasmic reticulum ATPase